jgi:hypothetical protein
LREKTPELQGYAERWFEGLRGLVEEKPSRVLKEVV